MPKSPIRNSYMFGEQKQDSYRYGLLDKELRPTTELGLARLKLPPEPHILELGCGIGELACFFAKELFPKGYVTAVDRARDIIRIGADKAAKEGIKNIGFVCVDAIEFDYGTNRYDMVHARLTLIYLKDRKKVMQKIFQGLKPGGVVFVEEILAIRKISQSDWPYEQMRDWCNKLTRAGGGNPDYTREELPRHLKELGFEDINTYEEPVSYNSVRLIEQFGLLLKEIARALQDQEIATRDQIDEVYGKFMRADPEELSIEFQIAQVIATKPSAASHQQQN